MKEFSWNYKIGVIYIASSVTLEWEWQYVLPSDISLHVARIELEDGQANEAYLNKMMASSQIEKASRLLGDLGVDVIVFSCTIGSLIKGKGWDKELIERIKKSSGGIPATSTATGLLEVLNILEPKGIRIVTPYIKELDDLEERFLVDNGFSVTDIQGYGCLTDFDIARVSPSYFISAITEPGSAWECAFISCTNSNTLEAINVVESLLERIVLSSNQVSLWSALNKLGYPLKNIKKYGKIFKI